MLFQSNPVRIEETAASLFACALMVAGNLAPALAENPGTANTVAGNQTQPMQPNLALQQNRVAADAAYHDLHFDVALQRYQQICQSPAHDANDLYWLGESYFHLGYFAQAAQSFEQSLAANPRADSVNVRLVQAYLASKQYQTAKAKIVAALAAVRDAAVREQLIALSRYCDKPSSFHIDSVSHLAAGARVAER
jgi:tetratricopeptide (TPR) repeat protein